MYKLFPHTNLPEFIKLVSRYRGPFTTIALVILLLALFAGCGSGSDDSFKTTVSGQFRQFPNRPVYLYEVDLYKAIPLDSSETDDKGYFRFKFSRDTVGIFLLKLDNRNYVTLVLGDERSVKVTANGKDIKTDYTIEGSGESADLQVFESFTQENIDRVDSLASRYNLSASSPDFFEIKPELKAQYEEIFANQKKFTGHYLEEHCGGLSSLLAINRRFGNRKILDDYEDRYYYLMLDSCLMKKYPDNRHVEVFHARVDKIRNQIALQKHIARLLAPGKKAPDLKMDDDKGQTVELYNLDNDFILLYFWSSRDKPSRQANAKIMDFYRKYRGKKLEVYAVAIESYEDLWKDAIRSDRLEFINVTDLMNVYSAAKTLYNVPDSLPYFYLLDRDKIILYKGKDFIKIQRMIQGS